MDHDVCCVEDVMPVGNVLDVYEVHHAAINQPVEDVAATASGDKPEANVLIGPNTVAAQQVEHQSADQYNTEECKEPASALEHPEYPPHIANMGQVYERCPFHRATHGDHAVDQIAPDLRDEHHRQCNSAEYRHLLRSGSGHFATCNVACGTGRKNSTRLQSGTFRALKQSWPWLD